MNIDLQTKQIVRSLIREFLLEIDFFMEQERQPFGMAVNAAMKSLNFEDAVLNPPKEKSDATQER